MLTLSLFTLTVLWFAVLYRYPAYFVPKKSLNVSGENWIEVLPASRHHEAPAMQEVA